MNYSTMAVSQDGEDFPVCDLWQKFFGDSIIVICTALLLGFGLLMVTSASIAVADQNLHNPLYYCFRQSFYIGVGGLLFVVCLALPMKFWYVQSQWFLLLSLVLLILVLIPGIGREVNGSTRWIDLGIIRVQVSEFVKFLFITYLASYLARFSSEVRHDFFCALKPLIVLAIMSFLLLLEPDFGATVILGCSCMIMLYLAGVRWRIFLGLLAAVAVAFVCLAMGAPYRLQRLVTFMDPWQDQFSSGYQLTQALIAFGQGGWWGLGLGNSVQKLFYLPEAHTDFVLAVVAEELGLVGVFAVIFLFVVLYCRMFMIARRAMACGQKFCAFLVYGIASWLSLQTLVSMGVNTGLLPTKGLTLPLISYGGSSLVITMVAIAVVLQVAKRVEQPSCCMDKLP